MQPDSDLVSLKHLTFIIAETCLMIYTNNWPEVVNVHRRLLDSIFVRQTLTIRVVSKQ